MQQHNAGHAVHEGEAGGMRSVRTQGVDFLSQDDSHRAAVLTVAEMYRADSAATASGISGDVLMERAGEAVFAEIVRRFPPCRVTVLAGPGNNGGDGFVIARKLLEAGWSARVELLGPPDRLKGDAALNAARWHGETAALDPGGPSATDLVVDALFGAGLARPLDGLARSAVEAIGMRGLPVVAVDIPSGIHGDTGSVMGAAVRACLTVTFFRPKLGHLLLPGRAYRGTLVVADIGIPESVLSVIRPNLFRNEPSLFLNALPDLDLAIHKYGRGHALVVGGRNLTGAGRLAARAVRRVGAGLTTVAAESHSLLFYGLDAPGVMTAPIDGPGQFAGLIADPRFTSVLLGPGNEINVPTADRTLTALRAGKACVLDADALSVFEEQPAVLFSATEGRAAVLTPHEGEFRRLFSVPGDKVMRVRAAARQCGAVVVLKGADTVIADPRGRAAVNDNAPADLATAGSGDVLAGFVAGLLAQGMPPFEAACMAVWLHGDAGQRGGAGLIAEDLPELARDGLSALRRLKRPEWARAWEGYQG